MDWKRPSWIPRWLNVPLLIFTGFIIWLLFFGEYNFMRINDQKKEINQLKEQISANLDSAKLYDDKLHELNTDKETLEKIAREKYGMKRLNEEVYVTNIP